MKFKSTGLAWRKGQIMTVRSIPLSDYTYLITISDFIDLERMFWKGASHHRKDVRHRQRDLSWILNWTQVFRFVWILMQFLWCQRMLGLLQLASINGRGGCPWNATGGTRTSEVFRQESKSRRTVHVVVCTCQEGSWRTVQCEDAVRWDSACQRGEMQMAGLVETPALTRQQGKVLSGTS